MSDSPPEHIDDAEVDYDVLVVGGGISGLVAASELRKRAPDLKIAIVEAKDRVGGRTLTIEMNVKNQKKEKFDIGGQWVGKTQTHILDIIEELGLTTYPQYSDGRKWCQMGVSKPRSYTTTLPTTSYSHGLFEIIDFLQCLGKMEFLARQIRLLNVFKWKRADALDEMTVSKWAKENCWTRATQDAIDIAIRSIYGVEAKRMSLLFHLYYSRSAGSFTDLIECVGDGAQAFKVDGGTQQISTRLAEPFLNEKKLWLNRAVTKIEIDEPHDISTVSIVSTAKDDLLESTSYRVRRVILAIPPNMCGKIDFTPNVPEQKRRLFTAAQGNLIKFIITYQSAFWRTDGNSGEIISTGRTAQQGELYPIISVLDACSARGTPALVGFIAEEYADHTKEQRCNYVVKDLVRFLGRNALDQFIDYEEKLWCHEPFNGGCPTIFCAPGQMDALQTIREPFHGVHFAGTESATHWAGYMSGAVQSGRRAAHEVLHEFQRDKVINPTYMEDSIYADNYVQPCQPSNEYIETWSPWWRRGFFFGALIFGIYAYSKKYQLTMAGKAVRPAERALLKWFCDLPWPG